MKKIYPLTITDEMKACGKFYVDNFGFTIVFEQDWYMQLVDEKSGTEIAFMMPNVGNQPKELHPGFGGKGIVYSIEVEDAEVEWKRLKDKKLDVVVELREEEWGQRHFILRDPSGVYVDVVQQAAENQ